MLQQHAYFKLGRQPHSDRGRSLVILANNWTPHPTQLGSFKPHPRSVLACDRWILAVEAGGFPIFSVTKVGDRPLAGWLLSKTSRLQDIRGSVFSYIFIPDQNIRTQLIKTLSYYLFICRFLCYFLSSFIYSQLLSDNMARSTRSFTGLRLSYILFAITFAIPLTMARPYPVIQKRDIFSDIVSPATTYNPGQ